MSTYKGISVLVTGAQGFMGSWLVERLLAEGASVLVPRRPVAAESRFARERLEERCKLVELDLLELESVLGVLNEGEVGAVFHLAAQTIVSEANRSPVATLDVNVRGTYNLLEACRLLAGDRPAPRAVIASSYHVYGQRADGAYSEDTPMSPSYPYDVSKACADYLARSYAATYGLAVGVTRMANVYGGGDLNWSRIVPDSARALVAGRRPVIRSDGTPERDYLYVEDAVDAYLAVARSLDHPVHHGRAWNVGLGSPVAVLDLVRELIAAAGSDLEPEVQAKTVPRAEIDSEYLDSSAIREELGWAPAWDLPLALCETYRWYEANLV
jgi:CDP-glucose 4,6-dehydratase